MPRHDNMFGGGNYDADDLDEWLTIQRDWQVDAGLEPVADMLALGARAGDSGGVRGLRSAGLGRRSRRSATVAPTSSGFVCDRAADAAAELFAGRRRRARRRRGFEGGRRCSAPRRVAADYLQTSA
jgi:hypothetical protein